MYRANLYEKKKSTLHSYTDRSINWIRFCDQKKSIKAKINKKMKTNSTTKIYYYNLKYILMLNTIEITNE